MVRLRHIKKLLTTPLPELWHFSKNILDKKFSTLDHVVLEKELRSEKVDAPHFPEAILRAHMKGSRESADRICAHEFDLLGSGPKNLGKHINWHRDFIHDYDFPQKPVGEISYATTGGNDIKVPWELSRFQFLPALIKAYETFHDEKYVLEAKNIVHDWILSNPLGIGVNWKCTMDTAIRACNFSLAWYFLRETPPWKDSHWHKIFLTSIVEHGKFILRNLEYGPGFNSNHFLADITGLLFLGILFPEFKEARKWKATALKALNEEIQKQVYEDGVDFEASIPYHRLVTEFFGYSALLCKENDVKLSDAFWKRLEKMFEFAWHYTKPNGLAPQVGDNDDGRLFIFEGFFSWERRDHRHLFWLAHALFPLNKKFDQNRHDATKKESRAFEKGGIYIMRKDNFYCLIDCGKNGQAGNAGHAHNDTLSFELSASGEDFIIDPGTYVYTSDPAARNKFRSTRMHSTVMIDDEEMNRFRTDTLFSMHDDAKPRVHLWESNNQRDFLDAEHNGYARLSDPVIHRRCFTFNKENYSLTINDRFVGKGHHNFEWNFHFAPDVILQKKERRIVAQKNGRTLEISLPQELAPHAQLREDEVSPRYGVKEKKPVLTITAKFDITQSSLFTFTFETR